MYYPVNIIADASLPDLTRYFKTPEFKLSTYDADTLHPKLQDNTILLCRSTLQVNQALLENTTIRYVATASSGSCHLDKVYLESKNIAWMDAKGANQEAVTDYMLCLFSYLDISLHQRIGIMGMGHVGSLLCQRLQTLGFKVIAYDPPRADHDATFDSASFDAFCKADVFCIHAEYHNGEYHPTHHSLSHAFFDAIKPGAIILNAARGDIIDELALLTHPKPLTYCTDVYSHEPSPNPAILARAALCTPHIAGHSIEAKRRAVYFAAKAIYQVRSLPPPKAPDILTMPPMSLNSNWQRHYKGLYNPIHDSKLLKSAKDIKTTFLAARKKHQQRHDAGVSAALTPACLD